ncbi:unnamed protein product [Diatraea saccharalis]|uniref:BTB domain-containing protein n=1 Tax=Diatraea saccharalis TaxID=40085 RepID=A0A9P0C4I7_9NEOP|nr:unnamed protein product [Diatraea saccharalis]
MSQPQLLLSCKSFGNNIFEGLSSFQQKEEFVDLTLAADGHFVKVHQMVLSLASPYLKELIKSAPCPHPILFLNQISYQTLCAILEYIYSGEVIVNKNDIGELIQAAKALHITGLEFMDWTTVQVVGDGESNNSVLGTNDMNVSDETSAFDTVPSHNDNGNEQQWSQALHIIKKSSRHNNKQDTTISTESNISQIDMGNTFDESIDIQGDVGVNKCDNISGVSENPSILYTLSNQGNIQMILNRYIYNIRYVSRKKGPPTRLWRCVDYVKGKCRASVTTKDDIVVQRVAAHTHSFHDNRILKKMASGMVLSAIKEAEEKCRIMKNDRGANDSEDTDEINVETSKSIDQENLDEEWI